MADALEKKIGIEEGTGVLDVNTPEGHFKVPEKHPGDLASQIEQTQIREAIHGHLDTLAKQNGEVAAAAGAAANATPADLSVTADSERARKIQVIDKLLESNPTAIQDQISTDFDAEQAMDVVNDLLNGSLPKA